MTAVLSQTERQGEISMAIHRTRRDQLKVALLACAFGFGACDAGVAFAQDAAAPAVHRQVDGEKILQLLVAKGVISQSDADGIVAQAAAEPAAQPAVVAGGVQGDTQTIPYIPEVIRDQIRESIVAEMASKGEAEGWARPGELPEWTKRITLSGDIRVRGEGVFFPQSRLGPNDPATNRPTITTGNDPSIVNFNAINTGPAYNTNREVAGSINPPFLNTTENRNRARIRARLGIGAELTPWAHAEIRLATGNDTSPVSTNQTLGGGNGDFSKYAIWLDRANIQFTPHGGLEGSKLVVGRAANPFWTTELIFDDDLNFDGVSLAASKRITDGVRVFTTLGAFPIYNTDLNFGSRDVSAFKSKDRWLLAAQAGTEFNISDKAKLTAGVGYFKFTGAQGQVSSPCLFNTDVCNTDNARPLFQQYGNSMRPIRNIIPDTTVNPGLSPEPQYFGLASKFHVLEAHAALELNAGLPVPIKVEGEYLHNFGFNRAFVNSVQTNVNGTYNPSGEAWSANLLVGKANPGKWGEWNMFGGYRHIGTDATIDAFNDSDFHLGGTNAKGYVLGGSLGIGGNISLGGKWLSSDQITGQPYSVDVLFIDLNAKF